MWFQSISLSSFHNRISFLLEKQVTDHLIVEKLVCFVRTTLYLLLSFEYYKHWE